MASPRKLAFRSRLTVVFGGDGLVFASTPSLLAKEFRLTLMRGLGPLEPLLFKLTLIFGRTDLLFWERREGGFVSD